MNGRLFRQKRRIILAMLAVMLGIGWHWHSAPLALAGGLGTFAAALFIVTALPPFRRGVESGAVGFLGAALLPGPDIGLLPFTVLLGGVAFYALYGRWGDRGALRFGLHCEQLSVVNLPASRVWAALLPGQSHPDDHWTGRLVDFDSDPDDPETFYLRFETPDDGIDEMTLSYLSRDPPRACRYFLETEEDGSPQSRLVDLRLDETADGQTRITCLQDQDGLLPRLAAALWFDDAHGDDLDRFALTLSTRRLWSVQGLTFGLGRSRSGAGKGAGA